MKAYYDRKPSTLEAVGNGSYLYRWNIEEVSVDSSEEQKTQWKCDEVVIPPPLNVDDAVALVIEAANIEDIEEIAAIRNEVGLTIISHDIDSAKADLRKKIIEYDSSSAVNSFTFAGVEMWLDKATRVGLKLRFEAEIRLGRSATTLWLNGIGFTLPLLGDSNAVDLLDAIELYASASYDVTQ